MTLTLSHSVHPLRAWQGSCCRRAAAFGLAALLLAAGSAYSQISRTEGHTRVTVHVHPEVKGTVPEALFGSFLEPIGNSINNGILAEILVNRSLEGGLWNHVNLEDMFRDQPELIESSNRFGLPLPWRPLNRAAGNRFELHVGNAANSWQSVEIMGQPQQLTGIQQRVYLPVPRELTYRVSVYARHLSGPTKLCFLLRDHLTGAVLAQTSVEAAAGSWTKYTGRLTLRPGAVQRLQPVDFALAVTGTERADVDQFSLMPDDAAGVFDPAVLAMAKSMHLTELRLGGNFSSAYHWRDGIGPVDRRPTQENIAWGIPEYNILGTDEFLDLCACLGVTPQFDLNMGSGTPEEAADWVRYIQAHHTGPVIYELGNELYGTWQIGYLTVDEIAARTLAFSRAVKAVAPDATIIATGEGPVGGEKWMAAQLTDPPGTFDDLSIHVIYGTNHPREEQLGPDFVAASAYALPFAIGTAFDAEAAQVRAVPGMQDVHLAITEWLFNSKGYEERNFTNESPSWMNEGGAVMAAGFLNTLLRHSAEIHLADMTGLMEFAGIWKRREQVYAVPAFYAFQLYTEVKGDNLLTVSSDSGTYAVRGGLPPFNDVESVPEVDVVATRSKDGRVVTLLCLNRSLDHDLPATFDLSAFPGAAGVATVHQIAATSRYERNDEVEPFVVVPSSWPIPIGAHGSIALTLPHESVSVIEVPVNTSPQRN